MTDEQLLRKMQAHQAEALQRVMEKYHRYVFSVVAGILGGIGIPEDIEELVQDTFYSVWTHADAIHGKLRTYLSATARNKAKSWLRGHRELPMDLDTLEIPDSDISLEDATVQKELARQLHKAIDQMRPKDREIFLRYYYQFQIAEEIAAEMGIPINTVYSRLARGKKRLKKTLNMEALV